MRIVQSVLTTVVFLSLQTVGGCHVRDLDTEGPCSQYAVDLYASCVCIQEEQTYLDEVASGCCDKDMVREMECEMEQRRVDACKASSRRDDTGICDTDTPTCDIVAQCAVASCVVPTCDPIPPT